MKMMKLALDTLDDRREIYHLLHRLPPHRRVAFVTHCCGMVSDKRGNRPVPMMFRGMVRDARRCDRGDERLTVACYHDLLALVYQWGLDLGKAAITLQVWMRQPTASGS